MSVEWELGRFLERLVTAIANYSSFFAACARLRLIGLINVLDDFIMTAYVHYLLVNHDYQSRGIGKELINLVKRKYENYLRLVLIFYND